MSKVKNEITVKEVTLASLQAELAELTKLVKLAQKAKAGKKVAPKVKSDKAKAVSTSKRLVDSEVRKGFRTSRKVKRLTPIP